jgi:plastocyanin
MMATGALALASAMPASQAAGMVYVSGPGGPYVNYIPPVAVVRPGDTLTYANVDAFQHDFVADCNVNNPGPDPDCQKQAEKDAWCDEVGFGGTSGCPLFWSQLIGVAQTTPVLGVDNLTPGQTYAFICTIHGNMRGTLVVLPV